MICNKCKQDKPVENFNRTNRTKSGRIGQCKVCIRIKSQNEKSRPNFSRRKKLKDKYGISLEEYNLLLKSQNGTCKICNKSSNKNLSVDHNHSTGEIRGLLCNTCNLGLGYFKDSPQLLKSASSYVNGNAPCGALLKSDGSDS